MKSKKLSPMQQGWEVEWCVKIPVDESGESDHDNAQFRFADFKTEEEAVAFAKEKVPIDQYGSVRVTPFHYKLYEYGRPPGSYREYDADPQYID